MQTIEVPLLPTEDFVLVDSWPGFDVATEEAMSDVATEESMSDEVIQMMRERIDHALRQFIRRQRARKAATRRQSLQRETAIEVSKSAARPALRKIPDPATPW